MKTRFSDQMTGDNRIPSIIYYDQNGLPKAIGAATILPSVIREAAEKQWFRAEQYVHFTKPNALGMNLH